MWKITVFLSQNNRLKVFLISFRHYWTVKVVKMTQTLPIRFQEHMQVRISFSFFSISHPFIINVIIMLQILSETPLFISKKCDVKNVHFQQCNGYLGLYWTEIWIWLKRTEKNTSKFILFGIALWVTHFFTIGIS